MVFYMFGKKSQSSLIILIGIISLVIIVWAITAFSQISFTEKSSKELKITKIAGYLDYFKGYIRNALILSTHQNSKLIASYGGSINDDGKPTNWICTNPTPPGVNEIRYYLSEETIKTLNTFVLRMNETKEDEIDNFFASKFKCVDYDINEDSVISGSNDEKFNVGGYGSYLTLVQDGDKVTSNNDVYEEISKMRFWYLYRKFREWAEENKLSMYICQCLTKICNIASNPNEYRQCYQQAIENTLNDLKGKFDEYVSCEAKQNCEYAEIEDCYKYATYGCSKWENTPKCNRCVTGKAGELCSQNPQLWIEYQNNAKTENSNKLTYSYFIRTFESNNVYYNPVNSQEKVCEYWAETRGSIEATFSCTDYKYALSTEKNKYLTFTLYTTIALKGKNCYENTPYECEEKCTDRRGCPPGRIIEECKCKHERPTNYDIWCVENVEPNAPPPPPYNQPYCHWTGFGCEYYTYLYTSPESEGCPPDKDPVCEGGKCNPFEIGQKKDYESKGCKPPYSSVDCNDNNVCKELSLPPNPYGGFGECGYMNPNVCVRVDGYGGCAGVCNWYCCAYQ